MRSLLLVAALLAGPAVVAGPARADTVIARVPSLGNVDADGSRVIWSASYGSPRGRYRVFQRIGGRTSPLPLRPPEPRRIPLDIDLGTDARGNAVAVFARCGPLNDLGRARHCDLYLYDFARRRERPLRALNTVRGSEYLASVWRGRIAFARRTGAAPHTRYAIYLARLDGRGGLTRLRGGSTASPAGALIGPTAMELRGDRVAYLWDRTVYDCGGPQPDTTGNRDDYDPSVVSTLQIEAAAGGPQVLDTACATSFGPFAGLSWPAAGPTYLVPSSRIVRRATLPAGAVRDIADTSPVSFVTSGDRVDYGVRAAGPAVGGRRGDVELVAYHLSDAAGGTR